MNDEEMKDWVANPDVLADNRGAIVALAMTEARNPGSGRELSGSSTKVPDGFFFCVMCEMNKPLNELQIRNGKSCCFPDVNSYSSLCNRWKTHRALKQWFKAMQHNEKVAWYRKQQECHMRGAKRSFDMIQGVQYSRKEAYQSDVTMDNWIPFHVFIRLKSLEGMTRVAASAEFRHIVMKGEGQYTHICIN